MYKNIFKYGVYLFAAIFALTHWALTFCLLWVSMGGIVVHLLNKWDEKEGTKIDEENVPWIVLQIFIIFFICLGPLGIIFFREEFKENLIGDTLKFRSFKFRSPIVRVNERD